MLLTVGIVAFLQLTGNGLGVLIVEFIVIGEFAVFWLFQSIDLWELETYQITSLNDLMEDLQYAARQGSPRLLSDMSSSVNRHRRPSRRALVEAAFRSRFAVARR